MKQFYALVFLAILFFNSLLVQAQPQTFKLLKDINAQTNSNPANITYGSNSFAILNNKAYFSADDGVHGTELWVSDGTQKGTSLVKDIYPGAAASQVNYIYTFNGKFYFFAQKGNGYMQFWQSDGTAVGTKVFVDGLAATAFNRIYPVSYANIGKILFFSVSHNNNNEELWKTDGTAAGTKRVYNFDTLQFSGFGIANMVAYKNKLFFTTDVGSRLWVADSSGNNIHQLNFTGKNFDRYSNLQVFNNKLYFISSFGLWQSDGDSISTKNISTEPIYRYTYFKKQIFCIAPVLGTKPYVYGLYKYDSTVGGKNLQLIKKVINTNVDYTGTFVTTTNDGLLYFDASDSLLHKKLWVTDGTEAGTIVLKDSKNPFLNFAEKNNKIYFSVDDNTSGQELWVTDGTLAGTQMLKDINPGVFSASPSCITLVNGLLMFSASNGATGNELWKTDGTKEGTSLVKDINKTTTSSGTTSMADAYFLKAQFYPSLTDTISGQFIFPADDGVHGLELWATDGSAGGTTILSDNVPGTKPGYIYGNKNVGAMAINNRFKGYDYFFGNSATNTTALYKTRGVAGSTQLASNIVDAQLGILPVSLTATNNNLFAIVTPITSIPRNDNNIDTANGDMLYAYNGNTQPVALKKGFLSPPDYDGYSTIGIGNIAYFFIRPLLTSGDGGIELWKTDGTVSGTVLIKNIFPGANRLFCYANYLTAFNGGIYFFASNEGGGIGNLWKTDGTAAGTTKISEVTILERKPVIVNGKLYFVGFGDAGDELWVTDGTSEGTHMVKDIAPGAQGSNVRGFVAYKGSLYFVANNGIDGLSIWKTDGTAEGTVMAVPGKGNNLVTSGNMLYFIQDGKLGQSDGTPSGTTILPNTGFEDVTNLDGLIYANGRIYFTGYNYAYGQELYVSQSLLPVSLLSFTAHLKNTDAFLHWSTVNEQNNSYFNVQRSYNGTNFTTVGRVNAQGNIKENDYNYTDANVTALGVSKLYYRLQQYDADGKFTYSKTIPLTIPLSTLVQVGPNPAADVVNIYASVSIPKAVVTITDVDGRVLYSAKQNIQAGTTTAIPLHGYAKGIYVMAIQGDNITKQEFKLVVGK